MRGSIVSRLPHKSPRIMAILNITPDSFSDGGVFFRHEKIDIDKVVDVVATLLADGADILDVGGESTRPGAAEVGVEQELDRVVPVIEAIRARFDLPVSIDTSQPEVMLAATNAGASIINDVRALVRPGALEAARQAVQASGAMVCLMHMRGEPSTMASLCQYENLVPDVLAELDERVKAAIAAGIPRSHLMLDPGFGFAKTTEQNFELLAQLGQFQSRNMPILVGLSRKRMIGEVTGRAVSDRVVGSVVLAVMAMERGADIVRVHDVAATRDGLRLYKATCLSHF
ncbi:dihydropteroate synthase [Halothiobacillus neapolitanus c2]|uniref:Dihydropteroate synthase n=2 Tax=Halothiobacillus neapolitanus TaxID=927 RepID=D0KVG1_HALNC|nr:dihydropteroate synthase [Halothiobacillus neapolitanus c2]